MRQSIEIHTIDTIKDIRQVVHAFKSKTIWPVPSTFELGIASTTKRKPCHGLNNDKRTYLPNFKRDIAYYNGSTAGLSRSGHYPWTSGYERRLKY